MRFHPRVVTLSLISALLLASGSVGFASAEADHDYHISGTAKLNGATKEWVHVTLMNADESVAVDAYYADGEGTTAWGTKGVVDHWSDPDTMLEDEVIWWFDVPAGTYTVGITAGNMAAESTFTTDATETYTWDDGTTRYVQHPPALSLAEIPDPHADDDQDGVLNGDDNCAAAPNADQADADGNGIGDACDEAAAPADADEDGVPNAEDNCVAVANANQDDGDKDGAGNACDDDADGDGITDETDNCLGLTNPGQEDADGDGKGNPCDTADDGEPDSDKDGRVDKADNCPDEWNVGQADQDGDGLGDACDPVDDTDSDGDGVRDAADNCPATENAAQGDKDEDGTGDACEEHPLDRKGTYDYSCPGSGLTEAECLAADLDGDGHSTQREKNLGSDPANPDTDGDGADDQADPSPNDPEDKKREQPFPGALAVLALAALAAVVVGRRS